MDKFPRLQSDVLLTKLHSIHVSKVRQIENMQYIWQKLWGTSLLVRIYYGRLLKHIGREPVEIESQAAIVQRRG